MKKYYTRVCNFHYGNNSQNLIKKKKALPLNGNLKISKIALSNSDDLAFIPAYCEGLKIYDLKDHQNIKFLGSVSTPGLALDVALSSDKTKAFVSDYKDGLSIIDVSDPINPQLITTIDTNATVYASVLSPDEKILYLVDGSNGVQVMDISEVNSVRQLASVATASSTNLLLSTDAKSLFVATDKGLYVYAVNGSELTLLSIFEATSRYKDMAIIEDGKRLLAYTDTAYTDLINIEDLQNLKRETRYYLDGKFALQKEKKVLFSIREGKVDDDVISVAINSDTIKLMEGFTHKNISIAVDSEITQAEVLVTLESGDSITLGNYKKHYDNRIDKGLLILPIISIATKSGLNTLSISLKIGEEIHQRTLYIQLFEKL